MVISYSCCLILTTTVLYSYLLLQVDSFTSKTSSIIISHQRHHQPQPQLLRLQAAPKRLEENVDGVLYVNDRCINCQACKGFAPTTFDYSSKHQKFVVVKQPNNENKNTSDEEEEKNNNLTILKQARAAMAACPVSAIRVENSAQRNHANLPKLTKKEEEIANQFIMNPKINGLELPFPQRIFSSFDEGVDENNNDNNDNNER